MQQIFNHWSQYNRVWEEERDEVLRAFVNSNPSLGDFENRINHYRDLEEAINNEPNTYTLGAILISTGKRFILICPGFQKQLYQYLEIFLFFFLL